MKLYQYLLVSTLGLITSFAHANITSIKVEQDVAYFSISTAKTKASPSCMLAANSQLWSLSLTTATGKASYVLLVAAVADKQVIAVTSANDCSDATGFERAQSIKVELSSGGTTIIAPKYIDVAYGFESYHSRYGRQCHIYTTSTDPTATPYLIAQISSSGENSYCRCQAGSIEVNTGAKDSNSPYFKCVIPVQ